jgi:hypothetical protein
MASGRTAYILKQMANKGKGLLLIILGNYVFSALLYMFAEHKNPITSFWWAIVTGFTVGYGDQYPATTLGQVIGAYLIVSSWLLSLIAGAYLTVRIIINTDEWTHDEQERHEHALLLIGKQLGIFPEHFIELPPSNYVPERVVSPAKD